MSVSAPRFSEDGSEHGEFGDPWYQAGREDTALPGNLANRQQAVDNLLPSWIAQAAKFQCSSRFDGLS